MTGEIDIEPRVVAQWATIYDAVYDTGDDSSGPDFAGWRSSVTGENYTSAEVTEWLGGTVEEIRRLRPETVLEIGAGSGLVVGELLPYVRRYVGTDISQAAVRRLRRCYGTHPEARFLVRPADQVDDLGTHDMVVLNSVIHHFPSQRYLDRALAQAVQACAPGGAVFLGDVHSLPLRDALRLCVLAARTPGRLPARQLCERLATAAARDRELVVDPAYFVRFAARHGLAADIQLKPGRCDTEMNLFRYDVRLRPRTPALVDPSAVAAFTWDGEAAPRLLDRIAAGPLPVVVTGIVHPGLAPALGGLDRLLRLGGDELVDVAELPAGVPSRGAAGVAPGDLRPLARDRGLACYCTPTPGRPGRYDAVFSLPAGQDGGHAGLAVTATGPMDRPLTNVPAL